MAKKRDHSKIKIGEKVAISFGQSSTYPTLLEDITAEGHLVISAPLRRNIPIILKKEQEIQLHYFRDNGRFTIDTQVQGFKISGNLRLIILEQQSEPRKQQRRASFRLGASLEAGIKPYVGGYSIIADDDNQPWENTKTNNISETGVSLNTHTHYSLEDKLLIRLLLPKADSEAELLEVVGAVRQINLADYNSEQYTVGLEFLDCPEDVRRAIAKFVLLRQQELLKIEAETIDW